LVVPQSRGYAPEFVYIGCYTKGSGGDGDGIGFAVRRGDGSLRLEGTVAPTAAPSYLAAHPAQPVLYAVNELSDGALSAWRVSTDGSLDPLGTWSTGGSLPCHVTVGSAARQVFVANYGSGSLAAFPLDPDGVPGPASDVIAHRGHGLNPERQEGPHAHMAVPDDPAHRVLAVDLGLDAVYSHRLDPATGRVDQGDAVLRTRPGTGPRHFVRDSHGVVYLVGELDGSVSTFVDSGTGLAEVERVAASSRGDGMPSAIVISDDERFVYVASRGPDTVSVFATDGGRLSRVGEVSTGGSWPREMTLDGDVLHVANERSHTVVMFRIDPTTGLPTPTGDVVNTPSPTCVLV
jgi:6-phosphogluconolactonase